jgi:hypothetical protein
VVVTMMWVGVRAMVFNATFNNASVIFSTISPISTKRTITSKNRKKKKKKDHDIMSLKMLFRHKNMAGLNRRMWNPNPIYLDIIIFFITKNLPVISAESE